MELGSRTRNHSNLYRGEVLKLCCEIYELINELYLVYLVIYELNLVYCECV